MQKIIFYYWKKNTESAQLWEGGPFLKSFRPDQTRFILYLKNELGAI